MELNREQIVKALECQVGTDENHDCRGCYFYREGGLCVENMSRELASRALVLIRELTEENERLRENCKPPIARNIDILRVTTIADTVRKMQERLKSQSFVHKNFGELVYVEDIDQIAKEMLEEAK